MLFNSDWRAKLSQPLKRPDFSKRLDDRHRFIVEVSGRGTDKVASIIAANQGKIHHELKLMPSFAVELPYFSLEELARLRWVKKVWHDAPVAINLDVAVPAVGGLKAWEMGLTGKGLVVAVLDTGIYPHPDLILPNNRIVAWQDILNQKTSPYDDNGHGTHVSGIIAGNGRSFRGRYKGIAPEAMLVGVKVLDENGGGNVSNLLTGIEWCLDHLAELQINVMNLSLGTPAQESYHMDPLCRATTAAWQKGITVCAAAGNQGPEQKTIDSPGINPKIITVGNVDDRQTPSGSDDELNRTSGRGPTIDNIMKPDLLAPGTDITSLKASGGYRTLSGTSMSTPLVAGAVALIIERWPQLGPDRIKRLLTQNARSIGLGANQQGAGVLDLEKIFTPNTTNKSANRAAGYSTTQPNSPYQTFGNHAFQLLMEKIGQNVAVLQRKRNELIHKTLSNLASSCINPLKQICGYQILKITMEKMGQNLPIIQQKLNKLARETLIRFIEEKFGSSNRN
jgi:serine protease AprX